MIRSVSARWGDAILICGTCTRRVGGGFGKKGGASLAKTLRKAGVGDRGRKAQRGVVETGCLKLCPKNAVVVMHSARPDRWLVVPPMMDVADIVAALDLDRTAT